MVDSRTKKITANSQQTINSRKERAKRREQRAESRHLSMCKRVVLPALSSPRNRIRALRPWGESVNLQSISNGYIPRILLFLCSEWWEW
jgi:hypothetical protein